MAALQDYYGPDWPLGFIQVVTPGTIVNLMSLVDPNNVNDPNVSNRTPAAGVREYTANAHQIIFQGYQPNSLVYGGGMITNAGNVYIVREGGTRNDASHIIGVIPPGGSFSLPIGALVSNGLSPYRYYLDADVAGDGAIVTLIIQ